MILQSEQPCDISQFKFKKRYYLSEDLSFIPVTYQRDEYFVQSPPLYVPFGINDSYKKKYIDLSFHDFKTNKESQKFLNHHLNPIYKLVETRYKTNYTISPFIKENEYSKWMRFKIDDSCLFFNQHKEIIPTIPKKSFGIFIFQWCGIWVHKNTLWFHWKVMQSKTRIPIQLKEYCIIEESSPLKIPPPPPPPPPPIDKYTKMMKMGVPMVAVNHKKKIDTIQAADLQKVVLRKTSPSITQKKKDFMPSLEDILEAKKLLTRVN